MKIQITRLAAAAATTILALSTVQAASAQSYQNPDCSPVTRNNNLNPGMARDWVFDTVIQKWLAPNSIEARRLLERHDACLRSLPDYQQRVYQESLQRAYESQQPAAGQYQGPYRQGQQNYGSYQNDR